MKKIQLNLSDEEKKQMKFHGVSMAYLYNYAVDELAALLQVTGMRAKQISALIAFQSLPSIGPKFAHDLIACGFFALNDLKGKNAVELIDAYEQIIGAWADPCLDDQFRLVVFYANNPGSKKQWWDFTAERKAYRAKFGYPANRPQKPWYLLPQYC